MKTRLTGKIIVSITVLLLGIAIVSYAADDEFEPQDRIESNYFTVYLASGVNESNLVQALNMGSADSMLVGRRSTAELALPEMLDTLFARVSEILDMHITSLKVNVKVCRDYGQLKNIYENLFSAELGRRSFYVFSFNTIYIAPDSFTREILGHEVAHAIISHYFVVQPPVKVQEVLAGYVEFQLKKQ